MSEKKAPFTYEKNFELVVALKFFSQHTLDSVTPETVLSHVRGRLTHIDTITEVSVMKVEQVPSQLSNLIERLAALQNVLDQIKEEIGK